MSHDASARQVPFVVLPDEELALLWGDVTAIPSPTIPSDEVLGAAFRSLAAAGLIVLVPAPDGEGEQPVPIPAPPLLWVRDAMDKADVVGTIALTIGAVERRVWAIYAFTSGRMVLEEVLEGGFRSYVSYSADELESRIDGLRAEDEGAPADGDVALPLVLTAPFDVAADEERQRLVDSIDLLVAIGRIDRRTGVTTELTLAEGVGVGRVRMDAEPPSPAAAETITVTRDDWSGATVRTFLGV